MQHRNIENTNRGMKDITFIGGVGSPCEFGGELLKNKNILARLKNVGYKVNTIDTYKSHHSVIKRIKVIIRLINALLFHRKDVFVLSSSFENYYSLLKLMAYLPFNYDIVDWVIGCSLNKLVQNNKIDKKFLNIARIHIVEAKGMKKELLDALNITNIKVLYNFRELSTLPRINKYDDGKIHFVFFSRITPLKGVVDIMSAVSTLNSTGYEGKYCVDFYGDIIPEYKEEFDQCIRSNINLRFCDTIQLREWANYDILARYHYMLFPTFWPGEGFPGAIIDSYIAGVPVIASDWAYVPEFIENRRTGVIIPTHDVKALISVMKEAIDGTLDCLGMSANCQIKAKEFETNYVLSPQVLNEVFLD